MTGLGMALTAWACIAAPFAIAFVYAAVSDWIDRRRQ